jgi:photosystem II stability/assembly factor-like uncharacterized protein
MPREIPDQTLLNAIDFVNATTGVVVGGWQESGGMMNAAETHRTTEGGVTWTTVTDIQAHTLLAVRFADQRNSWAVGTWGSVVHTTDGGLTWTRQESGARGSLLSVSCANARSVWTFGNGGWILHTVTGGGVGQE